MAQHVHLIVVKRAPNAPRRRLGQGVGAVPGPGHVGLPFGRRRGMAPPLLAAAVVAVSVAATRNISSSSVAVSVVVAVAVARPR